VVITDQCMSVSLLLGARTRAAPPFPIDWFLWFLARKHFGDRSRDLLESSDNDLEILLHPRRLSNTMKTQRLKAAIMSIR